MQYRSISNGANIGGGGGQASHDSVWVNDNPYASVGISSPDGNTGVNYCFANVYPLTSTVLQNQRALLFIVSSMVKLGVIHGIVTDAETGDPIEGASVFTSRGQEIKTDDDGFYRMDNATADIVSDITAASKGFNDFIVQDTLFTEDDSVRIDFALLHPEFRASKKEFKAILEPDMEAEFEFSIINEGNGPLQWRVNKKLPGNADFDPWQRRDSLAVGVKLQSTRLQGVVFADGKYVVAGAGLSAADSNRIYVLDANLDTIRTFRQFGGSRVGMYDLAYDGELVWGVDADTVYGFTIEGVVERKFKIDIRYVRGIEWDVNRSQLLICGRLTTSPLLGFDRDGVMVNDYGQIGFTKSTLAYWQDDPGGYQLYIFHSDSTDMTISKMNLETKETAYVTTLDPPEGGMPEGCFITNKFDVYSWVFIAIISGTNGERYNDRLEVWQLEGRRDWFKVSEQGNDPAELRSGIIEAGGAKDLRLTLNSTGLPFVPFTGMLQFVHNAMSGIDTLNVELEVVEESAPPPSPPTVTDEDMLPVEFGLSSVYPSPFNAITTIRYGADRAERIRIVAYDISGREVAVLSDKQEAVGWHRARWNASALPSGVYIIRLEASGRVQTGKVVLIK